MRKVSDICAAFHKEDFGERFFLRNTKRLFTIKTVNKKGYPYLSLLFRIASFCIYNYEYIHEKSRETFMTFTISKT
mgnify:FL=1